MNLCEGNSSRFKGNSLKQKYTHLCHREIFVSQNELFRKSNFFNFSVQCASKQSGDLQRTGQLFSETISAL